MYEISYERRARRELVSLPRDIAQRIALTIGGLADDPRPPGHRKVVGGIDIFRIRIRSYRVVYQIRDPERLVLVLRVTRRTERTYRGL